MNNEKKTLDAHCNRCGHETKHEILFEKKQEVTADPEYGEIYWITTYRVLECCGCEEILLSKSVYFSEADDTKTTYFPSRVSRPKPKWLEQLPDEYEGLFDEIYSALYADNRRLAMMGARTIIDLFILRKVGDLGGFAKGLEGLEKEGFIGSKDRLIIEAAVDAGHAAAHRAYIPSAADVNRVMDIVENVIQHDVLHDSAAALRESTPKRHRTRKTVQ